MFVNVYIYIYIYIYIYTHTHTHPTTSYYVKSILQIRPSGTVSGEEKTTTPGQKAFYDQVLEIRKLWKWKIYASCYRSWVCVHPESRGMLETNRQATGCHNPKKPEQMYVRRLSFLPLTVWPNRLLCHAIFQMHENQDRLYAACNELWLQA